MNRTASEAAGSGGDVGRALDELIGSFEAFKQTNDERLSQIERRSSADVVTTDKLERISSSLDDQKLALEQLVLKSRRPALDGGRLTSAAQIEHKQAFESYVRHGQEAGLKRFEQKAMSIASDPDGGFLIPEETANEIGRRLVELSPIRSIAGVQQVSTPVLKKPFAPTGPATGWVAETAARPQTNSQVLVELSYPTSELYAMPSATSALLDDSAIDIDNWIAGEIETAFSEQENAAFVNGNGTNRPKGFLAQTLSLESAWIWGRIGYLITGANGTFAPTAPSDVLVDTVYSLRAGFRRNANWVMNRRTQAEIRKLKATDGSYLWQPPATADGRATLMGFPVVESEDMPSIAANATPIAFGDFRRGYLIVDRMGIRILRDPYSAKPYVLFYTTKRVGGDVQDFSAIKLVRFGTA
jgi:HK97 family phage major capsid protein